MPGQLCLLSVAEILLGVGKLTQKLELHVRLHLPAIRLSLHHFLIIPKKLLNVNRECNASHLISFRRTISKYDVLQYLYNDWFA